jgi:hypothetical protein
MSKESIKFYQYEHERGVELTIDHNVAKIRFYVDLFVGGYNIVVDPSRQVKMTPLS